MHKSKKSGEHEVEEHDVNVHLGFKKAGKDFLRLLFNGLAKHIKKNVPVTFEIYGHSMGGALAAHAAYRIRKRLAEHLSLPKDMVSVDVVTFASAGFFFKEDVQAAGDIIGALHSMVNFVRKHDFARELTSHAGFSNPGTYIELDNFVQISGDLRDYFSTIKSLQEMPVWERLVQEAQNHAIKNYIETIKAGSKAIIEREQLRALQFEK